MKICFVVQRYGVHIAGGAEVACRELAQRLAARGHDVEVLTSCATSYVDWANDLPAGTELDGPVVVHRLATRQNRTAAFPALSQRVLAGSVGATWDLEQAWIEAQGPDIDVVSSLVHRDDLDVVVFFTYLYAPTVVGAARLAGRIPIVIHPTAHDEPPMHLSIVRPALQTADGLVYLTAEERDVVHSVLGPVRGHEVVIGLGVDLPEPLQASEIDAVAARFGLDEWLVSVGRVDPSKGTTELVDWYRRYRSTHEATPALVLVGDRAHRIEISDGPIGSGGHVGGVVQTGIVDEDTKHALVAGARLAVQPSFFESFSLSLVEAWSHGRAALVQGRCAVLAGQVQRSGGGVAYRGYAQFEVALETLLADHDLASRLGQSGRRYVGAEYAWPHLLDRYEVFLDQVTRSWERGARHLPG